MDHLISEYETYTQQLDERIQRAASADRETLQRMKAGIDFALRQFRTITA